MRKLITSALVVSSLAIAGSPKPPPSDDSVHVISDWGEKAVRLANYFGWILDDLVNEAAQRRGTSAEFKAMALEIKAANAASLSALANAVIGMKFPPPAPPPSEGEIVDTLEDLVEPELFDQKKARAGLTGAEFERQWMIDALMLCRGAARMVKTTAPEAKLEPPLQRMKSSLDAAVKLLEKRIE